MLSATATELRAQAAAQAGALEAAHKSTTRAARAATAYLSVARARELALHHTLVHQLMVLRTARVHAAMVARDAQHASAAGARASLRRARVLIALADSALDVGADPAGAGRTARAAPSHSIALRHRAASARNELEEQRVRFERELAPLGARALAAATSAHADAVEAAWRHTLDGAVATARAAAGSAVTRRDLLAARAAEEGGVLQRAARGKLVACTRATERLAALRRRMEAHRRTVSTRLAKLRARSAWRDTSITAVWWAQQRGCVDGGAMPLVGRAAATLVKPPRWDRDSRAAERGAEQRRGAAFLSVMLEKRRGNGVPFQRCRAHARRLRALAMARARGEAMQRRGARLDAPAV